MTDFAKRCWQAWQSWSHWPVFRVMFWVMAVQWLAMLFEAYLVQIYFQPQPATRSGFQKIDIWMNAIWPALNFFTHIFPVLLTPAITIAIVWRLKTQMSGWHSALMPRFRMPHLLVGAIIAAVIFLVMAVAPAAWELLDRYHYDQNWLWSQPWRTGFQFRQTSSGPVEYWTTLRWDSYNTFFMLWDFWPTMAQLAWLLFAASAIGWLTVFFSNGLVMAVVLVVGGLISKNSDIFYLGHTLDSASPFVLSLFAIDAVALAGLWLRLANLPVGMESVRADELVPWLSTLLVGIKRRAPGDLVHAGAWRRAGHRRSMGLGSRFIWLIAIYTAVLICMMTFIHPVSLFPAKGEFPFGEFFLTSIVSALALGLSWPQRFTELNEVELMRPARRADCAREIGLAMLFDAAELCFAMTVAILLVTELRSPASFGFANFWYLLSAAILGQALAFGLLVWTMRLRSTAASAIALALAIISVTMLLYLALDDRTITPAIGAAAVGIVLTIHAHRRWLRADMV